MRKINGQAIEEIDEVGEVPGAKHGAGSTSELVRAACNAFFVRNKMSLNTGDFRHRNNAECQEYQSQQRRRRAA